MYIEKKGNSCKCLCVCWFYSILWPFFHSNEGYVRIYKNDFKIIPLWSNLQDFLGINELKKILPIIKVIFIRWWFLGLLVRFFYDLKKIGRLIQGQNNTIFRSSSMLYVSYFEMMCADMLLLLVKKKYIKTKFEKQNISVDMEYGWKMRS